MCTTTGGALRCSVLLKTIFMSAGQSCHIWERVRRHCVDRGNPQTQKSNLICYGEGKKIPQQVGSYGGQIQSVWFQCFGDDHTRHEDGGVSPQRHILWLKAVPHGSHLRWLSPHFSSTSDHADTQKSFLKIDIL